MVALLLLSVPAHATNANKLAETQAELKATRAKADALALKVQVSEREMRGIRERATELARTIQRNEAELTQAERKLRSLEGDVSTRTARLEERQAQTGQAMLAMLQLERMPASAVFAQKGNATEMLRTAAALSAARERLARDAAELRAELSGLRRSREQLLATQTRARQARETLSARQSLLNEDLAKRSAADKQLRHDQSSAQAEAARLSRESKSLQELVNKVQATPSTGGSFSRRGTLNAPVAGDVLHRYGEKNGSNDTFRGMVLSARSGAVVVAPAAGEVAFTGPFMDYGPMVLLRHSGGYISLLAGLGTVDARIGQQLMAGEPVGRMGGARSELYVELRERGKPIDPSGWFANVGKSLAAR